MKARVAGSIGCAGARTWRWLQIPVILALGAISALGASRERWAATVTEICSLEAGLAMFEVDCGHFPSSSEGLAALVTRPPSVPETTWHGPYLEKLRKDAWDHDFVYRWPGIHRTNSFDLYSCGPDGVSMSGGDDPDDINNWNSYPRGSFVEEDRGSGGFSPFPGVFLLYLFAVAFSWMVSQLTLRRVRPVLCALAGTCLAITGAAFWDPTPGEIVGTWLGYILDPYVNAGILRGEAVGSFLLCSVGPFLAAYLLCLPRSKSKFASDDLRISGGDASSGPLTPPNAGPTQSNRR